VQWAFFTYKLFTDKFIPIIYPLIESCANGSSYLHLKDLKNSIYRTFPNWMNWNNGYSKPYWQNQGNKPFVATFKEIPLVHQRKSNLSEKQTLPKIYPLSDHNIPENFTQTTMRFGNYHRPDTISWANHVPTSDIKFIAQYFPERELLFKKLAIWRDWGIPQYVTIFSTGSIVQFNCPSLQILFQSLRHLNFFESF
jgi:hypothetical protein